MCRHLPHGSRRGRLLAVAVITAGACFTPGATRTTRTRVGVRDIPVGAGVMLRAYEVVERTHREPCAPGMVWGGPGSGCGWRPGSPPSEVYNGLVYVRMGLEDGTDSRTLPPYAVPVAGALELGTEAEAVRALPSVQVQTCMDAEGGHVVVGSTGWIWQVFSRRDPADVRDVDALGPGPCATAPDGGLWTFDGYCACLAVHPDALHPAGHTNGGA